MEFIRLQMFSRFVKIGLRIAFIGCLLATLFYAVYHYGSQEILRNSEFNKADQIVEGTTLLINRAFGRVQESADTFAQELTTGELDYSWIEPKMRRELVNFPRAYGIAATFQPYVYDPALRLYQKYLFREGGGC